MAKTKPWFFAVLRGTVDGTVSSWGFIDMLRYDRAIVHKIEGDIIVLQTERPPTVARWNSFGIPVWCQSRDDFQTIMRARVETESLRKSKRESEPEYIGSVGPHPPRR